MPLNRPAQALTPGPRGVSDARRWAAQVLNEIDRPELVEAASISVSEVITNALLHAEQPVSVRLRGTREHPRIEVRDGSRQPPDLPDLDGNPEDDVLLTFGRGLSIVARVSSAWGADIDEEGKTVWFVPRVELAEGRGVQGIITELQPLQREDPPLVDDPVDVTLIGLPLPEMKSNRMPTTRWPPPSRGSSPSSTRRSGEACATSGSPRPCSTSPKSST
jgi:anti-sigma regulatory factor (Ser/Thr protein kinase)